MADPRERWNDMDEALRVVVDRHLGDVWTAMPVRVLEDSKGHICDLQPTIKGVERDGKTVDMPKLGMVPIQFAAGGGYTITHPIKKDDEGIAIFASRCIDGWWDKGGNQPEPYGRRHNLSDAMYVPGIRAKPRQLGGSGDNTSTPKASGKPPSTVSVQIRTDDGDFYIELGPEGKVAIVCQTFVVKAGEKVRFETPKLEVTGVIHAKDDVIAAVDVSTATEIINNNGGGTSSDEVGFVEASPVTTTPDAPPEVNPLGHQISLLQHRHGGVRGGGEITSGPI